MGGQVSAANVPNPSWKTEPGTWRKESSNTSLQAHRRSIPQDETQIYLVDVPENSE